MKTLLGDPLILSRGVARRAVYLCLFIYVVLVIYFLVRGPLRSFVDSGDFLSLYAASRCWIGSEAAYAVVAWVSCGAGGGAAITYDSFAMTPSVYLPPALPLMSPIAVLPWKFAKILWMIVSLVAFGYAIWVLASKEGMDWRFMTAAALGCAPLHTALAKGQTSTVVVALIIYSLYLRGSALSGFALGIAICLKPQLAWMFLVYACFARQWGKLCYAVTTILGFATLALIKAPDGSLGELVENLIYASQTINDPSPSNPLRYQLLGAGALLPKELFSDVGSGLLQLTILLGGCWAVASIQDRKSQLAIVAVLTLMVGYHRVYDAIILLLALPVMCDSTIPRAVKVWVAASLAAFLLPGQAIIAKLMGSDATGISHHFALQHQTLACLVLLLALAYSGMADRLPVQTGKSAG